MDDIKFIQDKAHESLVIAMRDLKELPFRHRVSIEGKGVIIYTDEDDVMLGIMPIIKETAIEGTFVDLKVQTVPTEKSVNTAYKRMSEGKDQHLIKGRFNPLGVAMQIDKVFAISKPVNGFELLDADYKYYIPLNYQGTRILKVMVDMSDDVINRLLSSDDN